MQENERGAVPAAAVMIRSIKALMIAKANNILLLGEGGGGGPARGEFAGVGGTDFIA